MAAVNRSTYVFKRFLLTVFAPLVLAVTLGATLGLVAALGIFTVSYLVLGAVANGTIKTKWITTPDYDIYDLIYAFLGAKHNFPPGAPELEPWPQREELFERKRTPAVTERGIFLPVTAVWSDSDSLRKAMANSEKFCEALVAVGDKVDDICPGGWFADDPPTLFLTYSTLNTAVYVTEGLEVITEQVNAFFKSAQGLLDLESSVGPETDLGLETAVESDETRGGELGPEDPEGGMVAECFPVDADEGLVSGVKCDPLDFRVPGEGPLLPNQRLFM